MALINRSEYDMSTGGTQKVKLPTPGRAAATAQRVANTGGKSLVDEDSGTTIGKTPLLFLEWFL